MSFAARGDPKSRRVWRVVVRCALAAVALAPLMLRGQTGPPDPPGPSKLTPLLQELVRVVPQEPGPVAVAPAEQPAGQPASTGPTGLVEPLTTERLPKPVRDAMRGRLLRIDARNQVQVYILMAVTDANLSSLKSRGVTVEISDAAHQRVQARIPVSRLQAVADLPFVKFVRLPSYAVHAQSSPYIDSEGDAILLASQVRQQFGLDGTGVRVGVISDGIKGIFASGSGCTANGDGTSACPGVAGGPISACTTGSPAICDLPNATGTRNASGTLISSSGGITGTPFPAGDDLEGLPTQPCGFAGAGAEGTALLEIVHNIAPGAQLSFGNFQTSMDFENAVSSLASSNDVVVDDIGFFGGPYDGTSAVSANTASALNSLSNPIRAYVTSVGNNASYHYLGTYTDSHTDGFAMTGEHGDLHLFQGTAQTADVLNAGPTTTNRIELPTNGEVVIFLTWNDPFGASTNGYDYDLFLYSESSHTMVSGTMGVKRGCFGSGDPVECLEYTNDGAEGFFDILIQNPGNAAPRTLNMYAFSPECAQAGLMTLGTGHAKLSYNTIGQSVTGEADAGGSPVSVTSVGAICSASSAAAAARPTDESCADTSHSTIEYYSSRGPTLDGRLKPEVSGIDGVSITGAGSFENPFFGTSAAAPHIAGIAALLLQAASCLRSGANGAVENSTARGNLRGLILNNASALPDATGAVPNQTFGYGRADALTAAEATLPAFGGPSTLTVSGNTPGGASLTPSQLGFSDPDMCPLTTLNWSGGCGTGPASTMSCPFGQNSVSVMASNNGVSFSPAANVQIVVTDFSVGATPASATVKAGQSATYTVTVSPQGGAFSNAITLGCASSTLPTGVSCSFNPASVMPGPSPVQSTLTISTSGSAAALLPVASLQRGAWSGERPLGESILASNTAAKIRQFIQARFLPAMLWFAVAALILLVLPRRLPIADRQGRITRVMEPEALSLKRNRQSIVNPKERAGHPLRAHSVATAAVLISLVWVASQLSCGGGGTSSPPPPAPSASLSVSSLTFSTQNVGTTSASQAVTLSNTGNATLSISGIAASGDFAESNNCGTSVVAATNCTISVTFTPTQGGSRSGTLNVTDNASGSPQTVSLSGTGQAVTPAGSYNIGITGTSGTLVQTGTATLVVE